MKNFLRFTTAILVGMLIICVVSNGNAQDKKITKKDVPAAVLKTFESAYPKAKVNNYATEVEKGETFYELETVEGKIKRDLLYKADGTVVEIEESVAPDKLPDAVKKTLNAEFAKAKIEKSEKTTRGNEVTYELIIVAGNKKVEVVFSPEGKIVKKESVSGKKEKEEEEEKEEK